MDCSTVNSMVVKRPTLTPKAVLHQKYGTKACYKIEEVQESGENICPGLVIQQQGRFFYKCHLELPDFSVTSDAFTRKKDAEQAAAKLALEKLGIQPTTDNPSTPQELWDELVTRVSFLFTDEFLSSSHPLVSHFKAAFLREGHFYGLIPLPIIVACDLKTSNLCRSINPKAESDLLLMISLVIKAASSSPSVRISDRELWIGKRNPYLPEAIQRLSDRDPFAAECVHLEAIRIPFLIEKPVESLVINISSNQNYLDEIASQLGVKDSSRILISRNIGKASSELRLFFPLPDAISLSSYSSLEMDANNMENVLSCNERASYFSGQDIYGDAILATIGYKWNTPGLFYEQFSLRSYYRMLVSRVPSGNYKLSRDALFAAELPTVFTTRLNWRGSSPRELLSMFCRHHRLSEPFFLVEMVDCTGIPESSNRSSSSNSMKDNEHMNGKNGDGEPHMLNHFRCGVRILSRQNDLVLEHSTGETYRKQSDATQNAALKVLSLFNEYFKHLDMRMEKLSVFARTHGIDVNPITFSKEFCMCLSIHGVQPRNSFADWPNGKQEDGTNLFDIEGPESGKPPSQGSMVCISYVVSLVSKAECVRKVLESKDDFEFEIGTGSVIRKLEECVTQMSLNQTASFILEVPSRDLIMASAGESAQHLLLISLDECVLKYSVKLLGVTEPLEDRMEQALFSPPLSKQRVEFAVRFINGSGATTLVDFGCGSGSLLDLLLDHTTSLEKIVGVDISRKSLTHAAKILHSKLNPKDSVEDRGIRSAELYDGSITIFDSRLYGFDVGTCLEVIEHMEEDQASLFGEIVLTTFCPKLLIVSTPNYEYNPILQRSSLSNKEEDPEEKFENAPCKFRNHDHKFEWTREQFQRWATGIASRHNYSVEFSGVGGSGDVDPGFASQIAVFRQTMSHPSEKSVGIVETSQPYERIWEWRYSSSL